jgi:hypothetical protein
MDAATLPTEQLATLPTEQLATVPAEGIDLGALVPEMADVVLWIEQLLRIGVMAAPLLLLGFGLIFLLAPPKEANYGLGYRFWWGMSSLEAWQFTQRIAGMVWAALGAVLTIIMSLLCNGFRDMDPVAMGTLAGKYILWELGLVVAACIAIDVVVVVKFDRFGYRRSAPEETEEK